MKLIPFALLLFIFLPFMTIAQADLQQSFKDCNLEGSITIYDYRNKKWIYSDEADARRETLPASTFKIINSLIALETGAVKDENVVFQWDGTKREIAAWNADTDLKNAFKNSTVWFYVELARRIGLDKYEKHLQQSSYGNGRINTGENDDFWNYGYFGVTPVNQVEMLVKLYEDKLPFKKEHQQKVKEIMIAEAPVGYTIRAKTGWTRFGDKDTGWWIGYVEKPDNVYFFATRLIKDKQVANLDFIECRKEITRKVLKQLNAI
jgi:beta-lactamase class D